MSRTDPLNALLARYVATGEAAAMEELVRRTRPRLLRVAGRIGAGAEAEDAVQGAYHALLRRGALPDDVPVLGWLVTTVVRIAWKGRARARRFDAVAQRLDVPAAEPGPADRAQRAERIALVRAAVTRLPAKYRDPLVLHHLEGVPVADLARLMDVPESTVKTRLRRGRQLLERRLAPFVAPLFVLGWTIGDAVRPAALTTGGIMKAKTAIGIGLIAFASGATGYAFGGGAGRAPGRAVSTERAFMADASGETFEAPDMQEPQEPPQVGPPQSAPEVSPQFPAFERQLSEAAEELRVGDVALKRARYAVAAANGHAQAKRSGSAMADHHLAEVQAAVDDLRERGEEGFRALQAIARCGYSDVLGDLLARLCPAGSERDLIRDAVDAEANDLARMTALDALAHLRTPEVDAALRDLVGRSENPSVLARAFRAAAPRGVELDLARVESVLRDPDWSNHHRDLLASLGETKDERAAALLARLAREPAFALPGAALDALAGLDAGRARELAIALLDGPRGAELPPMQRARLRVLAGRWAER